MCTIEIPEFKTQEEEAEFWDRLDTSDFMEDDGQWFRFGATGGEAVDSLHLVRREGRTRYRLYGEAPDGRDLFVVLAKVEDTVYKPIVTRDMTEAEKQHYRKLQECVK